jgi:hypothetical protein
MPDQASHAREAHARIAAEARGRDPIKLEKALKTVENAPALTAEQVERLRALLPPDNATDAA